MSLAMFSGFARVGAALPGFLLGIGGKIADAVSDGKVTPDEAEALAVEASAELGDVKVKVKGTDIVDDDAQKHLAAFVGRVTRNLVTALKSSKAEPAE